MRGLIAESGSLVLSETLEAPEPRSGEVLVRVRAAGLNPTDLDITSGALDGWFEDVEGLTPVRTGLEFAGVVVEGGTTLRPAQAVYGYPEVVGPQKAHRELLAVEESAVGVMPAGLTFAEAASLPLAAVTVHVAHRDLVPVGEGSRVLVIGAAGGVGLTHVQVATRVLGAHVTAVAGAESHALLESLGADRVVDHRTTDLRSLGGRYDAIFDWSTQYRYAQIARLLADTGVFVPADPFKNAKDLVPGTEAAERTREMMVTRACGDDLAVIGGWVEAGLLQPMVDSRFPAAGTAAAVERLGARGKRGRVVLEFEEG